MTTNKNNTAAKRSRMTNFQTSWSIDALLQALQDKGVEVALDVNRTDVNKVVISITTVKTRLSKQALNHFLSVLYGINED